MGVDKGDKSCVLTAGERHLQRGGLPALHPASLTRLGGDVSVERSVPL